MMDPQEIMKLLRDAPSKLPIDEIVSRFLPSIRLIAKRTTSKRLPIGASHLGGPADLPHGFDWPEYNGVPMTLIAQIRLRDLPPIHNDILLPASGWLVFFYNAADQVWGFDPAHEGNWLVAHIDVDADELERLEPEADSDQPNHPCAISFAVEPTLPDPFVLHEQGIIQLSDKQAKALEPIWRKISQADLRPCCHRLLGHADRLQGDMKSECQLVSNGLYCGNSSGWEDKRAPKLLKKSGDWRLLLQIDSDKTGPGWMWGDMGRIYFWIRKQDLEEGDFDQTWLILQCG